ncbi:MAG: response regulator [Elusimicrobiota bacterium]
MVTSARLIVADDEPELLVMMKEALQSQGYEVRTAANGQEAIDLVRADPPDIVVVDLWMPVKDGFSVCRELKAEPEFRHLPIVILSASGGRENKIQGLDLGADDFITKPVDIAELRARIRMILRRTRQGLDANPLTRLPGNVSIQNRITEAVDARAPLAVLYVDINSFKAYNDAYGYDAGDRVIQAAAALLLRCVKTAGGNEDFVGHIGGDDFIVVTDPSRMERLCEEIVSGFDALAPSFYKEKDRERGKIISKDRAGNVVEYALLSVGVGVCHNKLKPLTSYAQVSELGSELKKFAKRSPGSHYEIDRRRE